MELIRVDLPSGEKAVLRPATADELQLVRDSWTKGASRGAKEMHHGGARMVRFGPDRAISRKVYAAAHRLFVDQQLADGAEVVVITAAEQPDEALGWVCWRPVERLLHWVWVRGAARRNGLGRALVEHVRRQVPEAVCTHLTPEGAHLLKAVR